MLLLLLERQLLVIQKLLRELVHQTVLRPVREPQKVHLLRAWVPRTIHLKALAQEHRINHQRQELVPRTGHWLQELVHQIIRRWVLV